MKSLALGLATKVKSLALALKPQALENCPVLGSRTALYFECSNFVDRLKNLFTNVIFWRSTEKNFSGPFFRRTLAPVSLVLGRGLEHSCPWPRKGLFSEGLSLALSLVSSTPPLTTTIICNNTTAKFLVTFVFKFPAFCFGHEIMSRKSLNNLSTFPIYIGNLRYILLAFLFQL